MSFRLSTPVGQETLEADGTQNEDAGPVSPPRRSDARRNHDALVQAATTVFAESGVNAPIKAIADRAGVGIGTLYRRFPKRSDLILAVFQSEVENCARAAETLAGRHPPFDALALWIDRFLDLVITKRGLAAALQSGAPAYGDLRGYFEERLVPPLRRLMDAAVEDGSPEISASELWRAIALLCAPASPEDFEQTRRMTRLLIRGLRSP